MKLVRLTADFPNVVYVLSFDRERVEKALDEEHGDGQAYLEKILQLTFEVPQLRDSQIRRLFIEELDLALKDKVTGPLHTDDWQNYFIMGIGPMISNLRDLRRYVNSLPSAIALVGEEIALSDVLAMEAIRVFCPRAFSLLTKTIEPLTEVSSDFGSSSDQQEKEKQKKALDTFFAASDAREAPLRKMIHHLFPCSQRFTTNTLHQSSWLKTWRKDGRVAHFENLRFYLEKSFQHGEFQIQQVRQFFDAMKSSTNLQIIIDTISPEQFEIMLGRIEDYEDLFTTEIAENAIPVLLNNTHRIRHERHHIFDLGGYFQIDRIVYRLLKHLKSEAERLQTVKTILPAVKTISSKLKLVNIVGHKENVGHGLIPSIEADNLEADLKEQVISLSSENLLPEEELPWILQWMAEDVANGEKVAKHLANDLLFLKVLRTSLGESFSKAIGQAAQRKIFKLPWPAIQKLVGDDLNHRVTDLFNRRESLNLDQRTILALEVAQKHVTGSDVT